MIKVKEFWGFCDGWNNGPGVELEKFIDENFIERSDILEIKYTADAKERCLMHILLVYEERIKG